MDILARMENLLSFLSFFSETKGVACLGVTLACACSSRMDARYCLILACEAGLPTSKSSVTFRPRPRSVNKERNLQIRLLTVPSARLVGHAQRLACLLPNKLHART